MANASDVSALDVDEARKLLRKLTRDELVELVLNAHDADEFRSPLFVWPQPRLDELRWVVLRGLYLRARDQANNLRVKACAMPDELAKLVMQQRADEVVRKAFDAYMAAYDQFRR